MSAHFISTFTENTLAIRNELSHLPSSYLYPHLQSHRFFLLSYSKGANVPIPKITPFEHPCAPEPGPLIFLKPTSIRYSLFYLWSLPLHSSQPQCKLQSPSRTTHKSLFTNMHSHTRTHSLPPLPISYFRCLTIQL